MYHRKPSFRKQIVRKMAHLVLISLLILLVTPDIKCQSNNAVQPFGGGIIAKQFYSSTVDNDNVVWFLTEAGVVSFNGSNWMLHNKNPKIIGKNIKDVDYAVSGSKQELWLSGPDGASAVTIPFNAESEVTKYSPDNSKIADKNVFAVVAGKKGILWFGTEKGVSALMGSNWLTNNYTDLYPNEIFNFFPLTTMAANNNGDTLYIGTLGGGVMRFYQDDVDAISGASQFAIWGPIEMPSDSVYSVYIAPSGVQWIGTNSGVAKHTGHSALEGWTIYDTKSGLVDNKVQAINADTKGNLYFGTKNGLSLFDGANFKTYKIENGLVSNNVLTITIDKNNIVWLGTDNGVTCIKNGELTSYQ